MIHMNLRQAALHVDGHMHGEDVLFNGCSTDSRSLQVGELFIALTGERFDGHDFIGQAVAAGASAAMVEDLPAADLPVIVVDDCRQAMNDLARAWRQQFDIPVVAITGSNGKTTVKEMVAAILSRQGAVLSTRGNLNNDIGVPLTLFGLDREHHYAVVEMGANHPGEIEILSHTAVPDVAVITQCAPAHLEGFGTVAGVAAAKAEIYGGLQSGGTAVINLDDDFAKYWLSKTRHLRQITFGLNPRAAVMARAVSLDTNSGCPAFYLCHENGEIKIVLATPGQHNLRNALAAAACALALGFELADIKQGLERFTGVSGRLQMKAGIGDSRVLDDTYNANPGSLRAGIELLTSLGGRHWLVLGDMGELGSESRELHYEMGESAREAGVERLYALGPLSRETVAGFGEGARHFEDHDSLIHCLKQDMQADVTVLVKGSRAMKMEQVVVAISREEATC
jgi:UDP-N-acetylmuramoyl-tripeptide--D-alanyl-D-alanine ligase